MIHSRMPTNPDGSAKMHIRTDGGRILGGVLSLKLALDTTYLEDRNIQASFISIASRFPTELPSISLFNMYISQRCCEALAEEQQNAMICPFDLIYSDENEYEFNTLRMIPKRYKKGIFENFFPELETTYGFVMAEVEGLYVMPKSEVSASLQ